MAEWSIVAKLFRTSQFLYLIISSLDMNGSQGFAILPQSDLHFLRMSSPLGVVSEDLNTFPSCGQITF